MKTEKEKKLQTSTEIVLTFTPVSSDEIFLIQVGKKTENICSKTFFKQTYSEMKEAIKYLVFANPQGNNFGN